MREKLRLMRSPRLSEFCGRFILHSGWRPDETLRLGRRDRSDFTGLFLHAHMIVDGRVDTAAVPQVPHRGIAAESSARWDDALVIYLDSLEKYHWFEIRLSDDETRMEILDDGIGFEPAGSRGKGGLGLTGMAERARKIGARLRVDSSPGRGTAVTVEVSIPRPRAEGRRQDG